MRYRSFPVEPTQLGGTGNFRNSQRLRLLRRSATFVCATTPAPEVCSPCPPLRLVRLAVSSPSACGCYADWAIRVRRRCSWCMAGATISNWDWLADELGRNWRIIAPDLRGSRGQWSQDGTYMMAGYVYDLAQLVHQLKLPVTIIGHSLGGNISLRYTRLYPENVAKLIAIEGLGPSPRRMGERAKKAFPERMRTWIDEQRALWAHAQALCLRRRSTWKRMQEENKHLTPEQARHLTQHGVNQNEDGTYSWKFDNYVHSWPPYDTTLAEVEGIVGAHRLPDAAHLRQGELGLKPRRGRPGAAIQACRGRVGHWCYHDRLDEFVALTRKFLSAEGGGNCPLRHRDAATPVFMVDLVVLKVVLTCEPSRRAAPMMAIPTRSAPIKAYSTAVTPEPSKITRADFSRKISHAATISGPCRGKVARHL